MLRAQNVSAKLGFRTNENVKGPCFTILQYVMFKKTVSPEVEIFILIFTILDEHCSNFKHHVCVVFVA